MKKALFFLLALAIGMASCSNNNSHTKEATKPTTSSENLDTKSPTNDAISYDTYINPRFGFSILYPTILSPQPEPENGDGRVFSNGKDEEMSVYASHNVFDSSIEELYKTCLDGFEGVVSTSIQKDNWFEVSGSNAGHNLYKKTILHDDVEYTVYVTYPKDKEQTYKEIIEKITESFKVGLEVTCQEN